MWSGILLDVFNNVIICGLALCGVAAAFDGSYNAAALLVLGSYVYSKLT